MLEEKGCPAGFRRGSLLARLESLALFACSYQAAFVQRS